MAIYTKTGDRGETGLSGGARISKNSLRAGALGDVDEVNAALGVALAYLNREGAAGHTDSTQAGTRELLLQIQNDLFVIGAELGNPDKKVQTPTITLPSVTHLEHAIDAREKILPPLKNFILPGGTPFAAQTHLARAICRRAERSLVALHEKEPINPHIIMYMNRLSDLLFMLARDDMHTHKKREEIWKMR